MADAGWQFWIDRGGTFTDIVAQRPDGTLQVHKLLSENPRQYEDAAIQGIREILQLAPTAPLPIEAIAAIKMGTTVATNALLERKGAKTLLVTTQGFGDALRIGYQNRPRIFARQIIRPEMLYQQTITVAARVDAAGNVLVALTEAEITRLRLAFRAALAAGMAACAIVFLHGYRFPVHEQMVAAIARDVGFQQVSVSHQVSPLIKLVSRGDTTVVDAYLSPVLRHYVNQVETALYGADRHDRHTNNHPIALEFMQSHGGLTAAATFQGKDSILSGPAGGIVGAVKTAQAAGFDQIITFDMGGTSTDVAHFAGEYERSGETAIAGVRLCTPMLAIHTVAAGGGSRLTFDGARLRVGPESAGANPGPACYRNGGDLTVTDCNVLLGRIQPDFFPPVFGATGDLPIDIEIVRQQFGQLAVLLGADQTPEAIAEGGLSIAIAKMASAIKQISIQRGYDISTYTLCCFGGAGGQHACRIADALGMRQIFLHPLAGVLSAYGMGLADRRVVREQSIDQALTTANLAALQLPIAQLRESAQAIVGSGAIGGGGENLVQTTLQLRYAGTDSTLTVDFDENIATIQTQFEQRYRQRYGFIAANKTLIVAAVTVEVIAPSQVMTLAPTGASVSPHSRTQSVAPVAHRSMYVQDVWQTVPVYQRSQLQPGDRISAPALIIEATGTNVLDLGWSATLSQSGDLILQRTTALPPPIASQARDPVRLEIFNHLFMAIAQQMGDTLQNTSSSVNIKERLDFSCALFDQAGNLIANAPHIPVHLGSMGESVRSLIAAQAGKLPPGDVFAINNPYNGGTHLPDVTVITPVFLAQNQPPFFVASRGHHADLGGITPGSMPPHSDDIRQEGILLNHFPLVLGGRFQTAAITQALTDHPYPVRNLAQNLADLKAQIAANQKGAQELQNIVQQVGLTTVQAYMQYVQDNAEESIRRAIGDLTNGNFIYAMDDGSQIAVAITIDPQDQTATIDFTGTSPQVKSNFNAPLAVVKAAVMYVFRTLVDDDIPLNAGCLRPLHLIVPEGCLLNPVYPAAVVAGNVETSQAITDALYGALGCLAASQGTMNNFTFGNDRYQYYETICGGSGAGIDAAGQGFDGTDAVQTHMTNSRLTDPEVLENRFPVWLQEFAIRSGSGGNGQYHGGNGVVRRLQFQQAMTANILSGHRLVPPFGLAGGEPGALGRNWVERSDGTIETLTGTAQVEMQPGDIFVIETPGGGGFGQI
jgi:5-oxoprolinase (ATP-hydrolysing)